MSWYDYTPFGVTHNAINWAADKVTGGNSPLPNITDNMNIGNGISWFTDKLGITDSEAQERGLDTLNEQMAAATAGVDTAMQPVFDTYQGAMKGRELGNVLDKYQTQMMGTEQAGSAPNVENFMNPMYGRAVSNATNAALAGAGSSALSTAGNAAIARGVSDTTANMWKDAFNEAMSDAANKQGVYSNVMEANVMPTQNWAQLLSDITSSKYDAATAQANAAANVAGQNRGWFSSLFKGVLG